MQAISKETSQFFRKGTNVAVVCSERNKKVLKVHVCRYENQLNKEIYKGKMEPWEDDFIMQVYSSLLRNNSLFFSCPITAIYINASLPGKSLIRDKNRLFCEPATFSQLQQHKQQGL